MGTQRRRDGHVEKTTSDQQDLDDSLRSATAGRTAAPLKWEWAGRQAEASHQTAEAPQLWCSSQVGRGPAPPWSPPLPPRSCRRSGKGLERSTKEFPSSTCSSSKVRGRSLLPLLPPTAQIDCVHAVCRRTYDCTASWVKWWTTAWRCLFFPPAWLQGVWPVSEGTCTAGSAAELTCIKTHTCTLRHIVAQLNTKTVTTRAVSFTRQLD